MSAPKVKLRTGEQHCPKCKGKRKLLRLYPRRQSPKKPNPNYIVVECSVCLGTGKARINHIEHAISRKT